MNVFWAEGTTPVPEEQMQENLASNMNLYKQVLDLNKMSVETQKNDTEK